MRKRKYISRQICHKNLNAWNFVPGELKKRNCISRQICHKDSDDLCISPCSIKKSNSVLRQICHKNSNISVHVFSISLCVQNWWKYKWVLWQILSRNKAFKLVISSILNGCMLIIAKAKISKVVRTNLSQIIQSMHTEVILFQLVNSTEFILFVVI